MAKYKITDADKFPHGEARKFQINEAQTAREEGHFWVREKTEKGWSEWKKMVDLNRQTR